MAVNHPATCKNVEANWTHGTQATGLIGKEGKNELLE